MGLPRPSRSKTRHKDPPPLADVASTPVASRRSDSPPWLGDDSPSPIPFICTQESGENEVVWNFNSPNTRPARRRREIYTFTESPVSSVRQPAKTNSKRRTLRNSSNEYIKQLSALNKCIMQIQEKERLKQTSENKQNKTPLKRIQNELSEGLESDDSINEHLFQLSQSVENRIDEKQKLENDDSFDNMMSNFNDSFVDMLTQAPDKENGLSKKKFGRHQSMPMSPSVPRVPVKSSNLNSSFGRHNSMPLDSKQQLTLTNTNTSNNSLCSQYEIQMKRKAAMEKLMSKKQHISPNGDVNSNKVKPSAKQSVQAVIERKRREAVQRLQKSQMKR